MKTTRFFKLLFLLSIFFVFNCKKNQDPPVTPTGLTLTVVSQTEIDLAWKDNSSNENGFKIERSLNVASGWAEITSTTANVILFKNTNLTPGTNYFYRLSAFNSVGNSEYSNLTNSTTLPPNTIPVLTTTAVSSITINSAGTGGNITADGGAAVTARGVCWSTTANPTISNSFTSDGTGSGTFTSSISGLTPGTIYYIRAYATNSVGTSYGNEINFTTQNPTYVAPAVTSSAATLVTNTSATLNGSVNANGSSTTVTFEYGTTFVYGSTINATPGTVTGITPTTVSGALTGLIPGQLYHLRVKAVSAGGTVYSDDLTFNTTQPPTATTQDATNLTQTTATFNGQVNANGLASVITFEYGLTTGYGSSVSGVPDNATGSANTPTKADITGLTQNTTYHFRIKAASSAGTSYGTDNIFTTTSVSLIIPTVSTSLVTDITQITATSGGIITSDGGGAITASGVCWSTVTNPTINDHKTSDGISTGTFISSVTGLTAGTTYYLKAYATNSAGTAYGAERSFSTNTVVVLPTITTTAISNITTTTAVSGGNISSDGGDPITASGICWGTSANPTTANSKTTDGSASGSFASNIIGLSAGTTYYVRAYATNSAGINYGNQQSFTTNTQTFAPPTAISYSATAITNTSATVNGQVNANNSSTTVTFEYGTTNTYGSTANATPGTLTGVTPTSVNTGLSGLIPGQTYHFRVKAVSAGGTVYGDDLIFITPQPPTATTQAASNLTQTAATLNGLVNANELSTNISIEYGLTTSYGTTLAGVPSSTTGSVNTPSSVTITGLSPNTIYHFRIVAVSSAGTTNGSDQIFSTASISAVIPALSTTDITAITETSASGGGNITSDGAANVTVRGVCWSTSADPTTGDSKTSNGTGTGTFTSSLTGQTAGTTYYVRAYAINSIGTAYGNNVTFSTSLVLGPSATTMTATDITQTTSTLNGSVNANSLTAIVTFEYGLTLSYGGTITAAQSPVTGSSNTSVSANLTGMVKNTQYNYRIKVVSSAGTTYGLNQVFSTLAGIMPTITTTTITSINSSGASSGGNVTNEGSAAVTQKGVCWSTSSNPTITDSKSTDGTGSGSFISTIAGLNSNTLYHVRAYAINSEGTSYGSDLTFTTSAAVVAPTISTTAISGIGTTTASSGGNVTNDGGATVSSRGVCWSTSANPTTSNSKSSDGTGAGSFTSNLTGLLASTTYHIRAYATNSAGTSYGSDLSFTTNSNPVIPTLSTATVTSILTTTAVSGGNITFDGDAAVTARGICWSTSTGPTTANFKTTDGTGTGSFISNLTGLTSNTTYYVRAYAINNVGTAYGNEQIFTTSCIPPTSATTAATSIAASTTTVNGTVNANTFSTTVTFEYGLTTSYGNSVTAAESPITGGTGTAVSKGLTGLSPNTVYHFRVKSVSCGGTIYGDDLTFTTLCTSPTATSVAATPVGTTTATINGSVNANGIMTTISFEYGLTTAYGGTIAASPGTATGSSPTSVTASLTGLTANTLYHFRVKAVSCGGTIYGNDLTLTTSCVVPTATTNAATGTTATTSTLNGSINANNSSTTATFQYGLTIAYGTNVTATQSPVSGSSDTPVSAALSGLIPNTTYHFRAVGVNCGGTINGSDLTFTTPCAAPVASAIAALSISSTTATLNGNVTANNGSTTITFEYGLTTGYGYSVAATPGTVTGTSGTAVSAAISSLTPNTTYNFRVKSVNCGGTTYSTNLTFNTACILPTATTSAATGISTNGATFNGTVNPNYGSATVTFDYGTTTGYGSSVTAVESPVTVNTINAVSATLVLTQNTTYHFRVKAVSCGGTVYASDQIFTTLCVAPSATTVEAASSGPSAGVGLLNGLVNANGNTTTVTFDYGISTTYGSSVSASPGSVGGASGTNVSKAVGGFAEGTIYYYRVVASSCGGTSYGLGTKFALDIDGNAYHIFSFRNGKATITWMRENLRSTRYSDLTPVPPGCDTCTIYTISYQPYQNNSSYTDIYGLLYNGATVNSAKNICPTGWHVPTDTEWSTMTFVFGGTTVAGGTFKEAGTSHWASPNTGADNSSGFTALGGGYYTSTFYNMGYYSRWWADNTLNYYQLSYKGADVVIGTAPSTYYNYIRCKK